MPWKSTVDRSGRTRFASPPPSARAAGRRLTLRLRDLCDQRTRGGRQRGEEQRQHDDAPKESLNNHACLTLRAPKAIRVGPARRFSRQKRGIIPGSPFRARLAHAFGGSAMPPVRKMRMPSSTEISGKRRPGPLADDDVAEIQVIRRHVDRHQRFRAGAAIDDELLRQEAEREPALGIFDHHHALEPRLVVRRKRGHELLHRRVDRPEHRHAQQEPPFAALQQALADDVGRERADQHDHHRRRQRSRGRESAGPAAGRRAASSGRRRR